MIHKQLFISIVSILFFIQTVNCQTDWILSKNKNGIKIYIRSVENSDIKEFKAITVIHTSINKLEKIIDDVDSYTEWQENISLAKVLKKVNDNESYIYNTTDIPWPLEDRDIIIYSKKIKTDDKLTYKITSKPDFIKDIDDFIRIKNAKGKWEFAKQNDGNIKVIYQFYADPEGSIPSWIINMFLVDGPYETLINLKKITE